LLNPLLQRRDHAEQFAATIAQTVLDIRPERLKLLLELAVHRLQALFHGYLAVETGLIDAGDQLRGELGQAGDQGGVQRLRGVIDTGVQGALEIEESL
jgi:hypothetical protein